MSQEEMRERVLLDPRTAQIAANLGVDLDEYVEQVVHYATHPDETPEFRVVSEETLRAEGFPTPTVEEIDAWFDAVNRGTLTFTPDGQPDLDGFNSDAREEKRRVLSAALSAAQDLAAPSIEDHKGEIRVDGRDDGAVLKQQLLDQRMNRQMRGLPVRMINSK